VRTLKNFTATTETYEDVMLYFVHNDMASHLQFASYATAGAHNLGYGLLATDIDSYCT